MKKKKDNGSIHSTGLKKVHGFNPGPGPIEKRLGYWVKTNGPRLRKTKKGGLIMGNGQKGKGWAMGRLMGGNSE